MYAPVAQLDRATASEAVGQRFESSRAYHRSATRGGVPVPGPGPDGFAARPAQEPSVPGLVYRIDATQPARRELFVELELDAALAADRHLELFLPTWTPGSYLVREFSRHLSRVTAEDAATGAALPCAKVTKNRFAVTVPDSTARIRVSYRVHAHELSVRTSDVTAEHAYWNHATLLLWPIAASNSPADLDLRYPATWQVACALPFVGEPRPGHCVLRATNLDEAIDSPCLIGSFVRLEWHNAGVPHAIVLDGLGCIAPPPTLVADLDAIVTAAAAVVGGPLPYPRYLFQALFSDEGHGGLEHANSTTLLMGRTALHGDKGYREFLGLAAHELFHSWNVKRLRPAEFWRYDYENENYTSFLWLVEGWTAYYDDLLCLRAGRFTRDVYLDLVATNLQTVLTGPGRHQLSLAESSFDAWIRLYRPDANTRNSSQNYYGNGAVAALCLDLTILRESRAERCLDDVLRTLWRETYARGRGYTMDDVERAVREAGGNAAVAVLRELTQGALDPQLEPLLAIVGITLRWRDAGKPQFGITFKSGGTLVGSVATDSPAFAAGIAPGDEILAVQGLRVGAETWTEVVRAVARPDEPVTVLLSRRGVVSSCTIVPVKSPGTLALALAEEATPDQVRARDRWLKSIVPQVPVPPAAG